MKRVFVDASCLYAAAASMKGGSSRILELSGARTGLCIALVSDRVLDEARRNIVRSLGEGAWAGLVERLIRCGVELVPDPTARDLDRLRGLTVDKDLHVLAAALKGRADFLVTLDRRHLLTSRVKAGFPIPVLDTKSLLEVLLGS